MIGWALGTVASGLAAAAPLVGVATLVTPVSAMGGSALAVPAPAVAGLVAGDLTATVSSVHHGFGEGHTLRLRDVDGDGDLDLLRVDAQGVHVRLLDADGSFGAADDDSLPWPSGDLGWHLADVDGDGSTEVALLLAGRKVVVHRVQADGTFDEGRTVLEDKRGSLPRGLRRVPFVRDVNDDGRPDLVLIGRGRYRIHLAGDEVPLTVHMEAQIDYAVGDPDAPSGEFAQSVRVPWFHIEDVDGLGGIDLVTETDDVVQFHLELSPEPTWTLDVAALKDELPDQVIDLDNLLGSVTNRVTYRIVDLDGTPPNDLIITQAATFRIYRDGAAGDIERPPDMVLKSSGNVLHYVVRDVADDPLPELQIIRGDVISLGQAARLLLIPGAIDFDVFTYANSDGDISRHPARRTTITLEIPALAFFAQEMEDMEEELKSRFKTPALRIDLNGDGQRTDVVDVRGGHLVVHEGIVSEGWDKTIVERVDDTSLDGLLETFILNDLDHLDDGGTFTIDLGDIRNLRLTPGHELRELTTDREPALKIALPFLAESAPIGMDPMDPPEIELVDVNRDGIKDAVIKANLVDGTKRVAIFVFARK